MAVLQAAIISFYYPVTWIFPTLILAGGLTTLVVKYKEVNFLYSTAQMHVWDTIPVVAVCVSCGYGCAMRCVQCCAQDIHTATRLPD